MVCRGHILFLSVYAVNTHLATSLVLFDTSFMPQSQRWLVLALDPISR